MRPGNASRNSLIRQGAIISTFWIECFGGQLEAALVISLSGRPVSVGDGSDFTGDLQTDFADQRTSDRGPQQIYLFVLGLPRQNRKGEIAAEFFAGIDDRGTTSRRSRVPFA